MTEVNTSVPTVPYNLDGSVPVEDFEAPAHPARRRSRRRSRRRCWRRRRRRSWWKAAGWSLLVLVVLGGASFVVPAQTLGRVIPGQLLIDRGAAVTRPGSAQPVGDRVEIRGRTSFPPEGEFLFTTVAVDLEVSVFEWIEAEVNDDYELQPREHILGDLTPRENRTRNLEMMNRSKDDAVTAALEFLGVPVEETGVGFNVVVSGGPVDGLLTVEEVIVAVDGVETGSLQSLRSELIQKSPGSTGVLTVENEETLELRDVSVVWGEHPEGLEGAYIGIGEVVTRIGDLTQGIDVEIDTGSTGGPSAGLAFSLAIIDALTQGELTGGQTVAVTGQIFVGGIVGNVGGVGQKAVAARSAGAVAFIVPEGLVAEAEASAGGMRVFGVSTLTEAVEALGVLGGDTGDLRIDL